MKRKMLAVGILLLFIGTSGIASTKMTSTLGLETVSTPPPPIIHGPTNGWTGVAYTFWTDPITDPNGDSFYCKWDWGDGIITEWLAPYPSGSNISASHTWAHEGVYEVQAKLTIDGNESDWSEPHTITIVKSGPPLKPLISGPIVGRVGVLYNFSVTLTDPEGDEFFYFWDWGDGNSSGWLGPFASGQIVTLPYAWTKPGIYSILVKAKDPYGVESVSDPFVIQIVKLRLSFILGLLTHRSETEDLFLFRTTFGLIIPSPALLYAGQGIAVAKQFLGFFGRSMIGGIFQAALLVKNP